MDLLSGRYKVDDVVYSDTEVTVHHGYDQLLNRAVTVELVRPELTDGVAAAALREKARQMAITELPYVAALYDQGEESGRPYLILEEQLGIPIGQAAPLAPDAILALIGAIAAIDRASQAKHTTPPRLDEHTIHIGADNHIQVVVWGTRGESAQPLDVASVARLLALAATGSTSDQTRQRVPGPLLHVIEQAQGGGYASIDTLEQAIRQAVTAAHDPTVAVHRAPPTLPVNTQDVHAWAPSAPGPRPARRPTWWILGAVGLLIAIAVIFSTVYSGQNRSAASSRPTPLSGQAVTAPTATPLVAPTAPVGTPYIVNTVGGRRLNVRKGPGQNSPVIGVLPNGTPVNVIEGPIAADGYRWVHVDNGQLSGWCALEALKPQ